ncbi:MAG: hypothetical protein KGL35_25365, partial [Bradyrhizobium sp.]|nr:hypothetical protein [Bradyrhizobium sp.]
HPPVPSHGSARQQGRCVVTTLDIYTSKMYRVRVKVRHGRKHGMPRGRGRVMWRLSPNRITLSAETRERSNWAEWCSTALLPCWTGSTGHDPA